MKPIKALGLIAALLSLNIAHAEDRYVTLTVKTKDDPAELVVAAGEVAEFKYCTVNTTWSPRMTVLRDGLSFEVPYQPLNQRTFPQEFVVSGPCTVQVNYPYSPPGGTSYPTLYVFKIHRQSTPPDKTVVIPPGQGGLVTLQCSSNLVDWVTTTNALHTNVPSMKFFRVNVERVP